MTKKIFIDCGAHKGESIEKFIKYYKNSSSYEIHSFEPNPKHKIFFEKYKNVIFHNKAVWVKDDIVDYYGIDEPNRTEGYTIVTEKNDISHQKPIKVESIDLSKWILTNFSIIDYIVLKLDVEGAEYEILTKMIDDGSIKYIDKLYVEFHLKWMNINKSVHKTIIKKLKVLNIEPYFWDALDLNFNPRRRYKLKLIKLYKKIISLFQ